MAYKEVEWLFQRDVEETYNITVGGEVIRTTDEHPFWIVGKGWVEAQHLVVGDVLTTSDGKELSIEKIEVKQEHVPKRKSHIILMDKRSQLIRIILRMVTGGQKI